MADKYGMLIDAQYCTGCRSCEMACNQEFNFDPGVFGLKVMQLGPINISGDKWQYDFFTVPTDWCNTCAVRRSKGKKPTCVQHCQAFCLEVDTLDALIPKITSNKHMLFVIR